MFPGAQEFKNKVLWIHKPGGAEVLFTILRPVIYLRPISPEHPVVEYRIQFTIPKADEPKFNAFLEEHGQQLKFVFESPSARYEGLGEVKAGPKPFVVHPVNGSGLTRVGELTEAEKLEREAVRGR
jgi:hypothetical protein